MSAVVGVLVKINLRVPCNCCALSYNSERATRDIPIGFHCSCTNLSHAVSYFFCRLFSFVIASFTASFSAPLSELLSLLVFCWIFLIATISASNAFALLFASTSGSSIISLFALALARFRAWLHWRDRQQ